MKVLKSTKTKLGNEIQLIGSENSKPILVIGVFHGEEPQGKFLIDEYLKTHSSNLLFIPCLNPDGMQFGKRTNANDVDLNRNGDVAENLQKSEIITWIGSEIIFSDELKKITQDIKNHISTCKDILAK